MADRFNLIVDAMVMIAHHNIRLHLHGHEADPDKDELYWGAIAIANELGMRDALAVAKDPELDLRVPFSDDDLAWQYVYAKRFKEEELELERSYPSNPNGHTLYCPRGCNQLHTTDGHAECGACGALMTPENEEPYYDGLVAAGQCM